MAARKASVRPRLRASRRPATAGPGYSPYCGDFWSGTLDAEGWPVLDASADAVIGQQVQACAACHVARAAEGYVFGVPRRLAIRRSPAMCRPVRFSTRSRSRPRGEPGSRSASSARKHARPAPAGAGA